MATRSETQISDEVIVNYIPTAYVLIDFDNFFPDYKGTEQSNNNLLDSLISIAVLIKEKNICKSINIRLYGGWYSQSVLTQKASSILGVIQNSKIFPIIDLVNKIKIDGTIDLSSTLIEFPEYIFDNTLKEKKGLGRIKLNKDADTAICAANTGSCPGRTLRNMAKSYDKNCPVSSCVGTNSSIFVSQQQKMVDTLIACDLITVARMTETKECYLLSDDVDHIPSLMLSAMNNSAEINLLHLKLNVFEYYSAIFSTLKINTYQWT
jgi:hypothetical protein